MYYEREIETKIKKYIDSPEIIAIFGSRQVGKTTILKHIYNNSQNALFLTFEDIETKILFQEDIKSFITYNELANLIGVNAPQLKNYLTIFEKAFVIKQIPPFFTKNRLEIVKNPKLFFYDLGLRNVVIKNFNSLENRMDKGAILENFVFR
jgi:predicted AAA+ superfamily ATPase